MNNKAVKIIIAVVLLVLAYFLFAKMMHSQGFRLPWEGGGTPPPPPSSQPVAPPMDRAPAAPAAPAPSASTTAP